MGVPHLPAGAVLSGYSLLCCLLVKMRRDEVMVSMSVCWCVCVHACACMDMQVSLCVRARL